MTHDQLTYDDLLRIVELIKTSEQFSEFRLKIGDIEVELRRRAEGTAGASTAGASASPSAVATGTPGSAAGSGGGPTARPDPAVPERAPPRVRAEERWPEGSIVIRSPMVGTFYRAPEPGAPAFVEVGGAVDPDTTVCIIEVMKLMNSIAAGAPGKVTHILVGDAEAVAAGEALIVLEPAR